MKEYHYRGSTYLFADRDVPAGAVLVETKQAQPLNKAAAVQDKAVKRGNSATSRRGRKPRTEGTESG